MSWPGGLDPNLLRQLQQSLAAQTSGMTPMNTTMPTPQPPPSSAPAAVDNAMHMMMARAMSVPLATVLFQSMMGTAQQPPAQPMFHQSPPLFSPVNQSVPAAQAASPLMQPALLQMMQHVANAAAASSAAAAPSPMSVPAAAAPLQVSVPPAAPPRLPSPASASTGSSPSPGIHLPPMDPSVAKDLLVQLVQQLQQAGQLPYDDTVQRLLQPNADTTGVEVKKEAVQQTPEQSPICVISKTEGFDEKPAAEVYMDNAEDNTGNSVCAPSTRGNVRRSVEGDSNDDEVAVSRSARTTKSSKTVVARGKQRDSRQKSLSRPSGSSAAADADPKLQKKCIVRLDRVDVTKKPASTPAAQLSRVDRLKNMKKHYVSTDILQTSGAVSTPSSESRQPTAATTAAASSIKLDDHKPCPKPEMVPMNLQSAAPTTRTGTRNIFSIFAQHVPGRVQQEEPVVEVRPSDPLPPSLGVLLQRSVNCVDHSIVSLRSMYLGYASHNMEWLSLISSIFGGGHKTFCQCTFCPKLGELPRDVAVHISNDHQDLLFALNKLKPVIGPMVYIKCRHCNFVTVEATLSWIHFDIHHGISDILDCSDRAADIDLTGPDMPERFIDIDEVMGPLTAYVCFDCSAVNAEPDTNASAMLMARHVACQHPDSINCNGNFVKLMMLARTEGDPDSIKGSPTYRQAITEDQHIRGRREVYICMFCRYSAFSPYLALSHSISAHQIKTMLFICNNGDCDYQCVAEVDMVQHMRVEHSDYGNSIPLVCSSTLVVRKSSGDGFVECPVLVKRTGSVEFVTSCKVKSKSLPARTAVTAKRSVRHVSVSSSDDDDDDESEDEEVPPKRHNLRQKANTKGTKTQKAGGREAGGRETKQASNAKATKHKRARIDIESEEELQNTTVTSTNDRTSITTTASATVTTEESNDDQTQNMETDIENSNSRLSVTTAAEQVEDDTEDEETGVIDQAGQVQDKTEDAETDCSNVMTASEQDDETGNNSNVITTVEQTTEDNTEDETGDGETDAEGINDQSGESTAIATAGESLTAEHEEAADDDTDNREIDTDTANDQVSDMSAAAVNEIETVNRGIESDDEGVDYERTSPTSPVAAVDSPSDSAAMSAPTAVVNETETTAPVAVTDETETGNRGSESDEKQSADERIDDEQTSHASPVAAVDSPPDSAATAAPAAVTYESENLPVTAETAE